MRIIYSIIFLVVIGISLRYLDQEREIFMRNPNQVLPVDSFRGRWQMISTEKNNNDIGVLHQIEFVGSEMLIYNRTVGHSVEQYNIVFHYSLGEGDKIIVHGRYRDELKVTQAGDSLYIISNGNLIPDGRYKRVASISWPGIGMIFGIVSILLLNGIYRSYHRRWLENARSNPRHTKSNWLNNVLQLFVGILLFGSGLLLGEKIWIDWRLLLIRIPWDALILFELSLIIAISATGIIIWARTSPMQVLLAFLWRYLGIALIGSSLYGIIVGAMQIIVFLLFGSYL